MNKQEFLTQLRNGLSGLPQDESEEHVTFYSEMIDDRMEEGFSEEAAVAAVGSIDDIISQIVAEVPLTKPAKEKITPKKKLRAWEIVLLILGSPLWLSLLLAIFAVVLSLYVTLWAVIISFWAAFVSVVAGAFCGVIVGVVLSLCGNGLTGIALLGASLVCAGLSIFLFFGCKAATKGTLLLTKKFAVWMKNCFMKKEEA